MAKESQKPPNEEKTTAGNVFLRSKGLDKANMCAETSIPEEELKDTGDE